jgi:chaperonin cofactor prefoldin
MSQAIAIRSTQVPAEYIKLVTAQNREVKRDQGLILTREDIINIKRYVKDGLALPTAYNEVVAYLGYSQSGIVGLEPNDIQILFTAIRENAKQWDSIESGVKKQSLDLDNFAARITSVGGRVIDYINRMDIIQQVLQTVGETGLEDSGVEIPFTDTDRQVANALSNLIKILKADVEKEQAKTASLKAKITTFKLEIVQDLEPAVQRKWTLVRDNKVADEIENLRSQIQQLDERIDQLQKDYDKYVGLAFTGAAGGIIGLSITGGIFGDKAEKARKEKNRLIQQKQQLEQQLNNRQMIFTAMSSLNNRFKDLHIRLIDAEKGVEHLEFVWASLHTHISNSLDKFSAINDGLSLLEFVTEFEQVVSPWKQVKDSSSELIRIFDAALEEYKRLYHA